MAQVPYSGVPEISPQFSATPEVRADVPAGAFGAASAQGIGQLGKGFGEAGGELWNRAIALQQLDQQTKALNANADAVDKVSDAYAQFSTLEGRKAMAMLPTFKQQVMDIHAQIGQGLESDYARKMYQQESRASQTRVFFSAAKHAGDQFKNYLKGSTQAAVDSAARSAGANPESDETYNNALATNESQSKAMGQYMGWDETQTKNYLDKMNSATVYTRAQALANKDPIAAQKMLDSAVSKNLVDSETAGKLTTYIRSQKDNVMSRNESAKFMAGEATPGIGDGPVNIQSAATAIKQIESSGNYNPKHPDVTHRVNGQMITEHALGAYGIMQSNLQPWLKEAGMPAMSEQQFLNDHDAQDRLFEFKFGQMMKEHGSANKAANVWFTGRPDPKPDANDGGTSAPEYQQKFRAGLLKQTNGTQLESAAKARAEQLAPGDAEFAQTFTNRVRVQHSHDQQLARQDEYDRQNTMLEAVGPGPDGKLPTSVDEMGPDARDAYMNSGVKKQRQIDKILMQNTRNGYAETPENTRQYQRLMGIANDPTRGEEATKELLDTDVNNLEMPWKWKQDIAKQRMAVFKNTQKNPALGHAMGLLAPMLDAAGVSKKSSKDDYFVFQGALHSMMQDKMQDGKPLNDDDIKKMGASLLRKTTQPWGPFGMLSGQNEAFRTPVPEDDRKQIIEAYKRSKGVVPIDREIQSIYAAKQAREFNLFYGKKKAQESETPTVPRSQ